MRLIELEGWTKWTERTERLGGRWDVWWDKSGPNSCCQGYLSL